jgi:hypothetical protein
VPRCDIGSGCESGYVIKVTRCEIGSGDECG